MTTQKTIDQAHALLPHLIHAAKAGNVDTYEAFGATIGVLPIRVIALVTYLRDAIEAAGDFPRLTAIVVSKKTRMPGDNFLPDETRKMSREQKRTFYDKLQRQVHAFPHWDTLPADLELTRGKSKR
jgi:hypothetical protein